MPKVHPVFGPGGGGEKGRGRGRSHRTGDLLDRGEREGKMMPSRYSSFVLGLSFLIPKERGRRGEVGGKGERDSGCSVAPLFHSKEGKKG